MPRAQFKSKWKARNLTNAWTDGRMEATKHIISPALYLIKRCVPFEEECILNHKLSTGVLSHMELGSKIWKSAGEALLSMLGYQSGRVVDIGKRSEPIPLYMDCY